MLDRDTLAIEYKDRNQHRTLMLKDYPVIWAFVESIRATLAGDLPALSRFYDVSLQGNLENWTLRLVPKDAKTRELVTAIHIFGGKDAIRSIETLEGDGDRTNMTILAETR